MQRGSRTALPKSPWEKKFWEKMLWAKIFSENSALRLVSDKRGKERKKEELARFVCISSAKTNASAREARMTSFSSLSWPQLPLFPFPRQALHVLLSTMAPSPLRSVEAVLLFTVSLFHKIAGSFFLQCPHRAHSIDWQY